MTDETPWHVTNRFNAEGVGGICVERNAQLGYAKSEWIPNEKLAADLARMVGLPIPRVEIGTVVGYGNQPFAISHVRSEHSRPLVPKRERNFHREYSAQERTALRAASCLLPFLAWVAADDHNDDSNLVVEVQGDDIRRIVAVDFGDAFMWRAGERVIVLPKRPALVTNVDPVVVRAALAAIEGLSAERICAACAAAGYRPDIRERNERVLQTATLAAPAL